MQLFIQFLTALFVSMVATPVLIRLAAPLGFVDMPNPRKIHSVAIPRVGGVGMVLGTVSTLLLWVDLEPSANALLGGIGLLSIVGIADDRYDLHYFWKLLGQCLAVLFVVQAGDVAVGELVFCGAAAPGWLVYPLSVFFLLGATNAMNLSDGLDGLAAGLGILSLGCVAYLAKLADGEQVVAVCVTIIAATLGFLRYNTHPAVVFMGDTGSQFLGFSAGVLSMALTQQANTALSAALPLLILGLPVADTLLVMAERMLRGRSPFKPDRNHFHHKLLALGLSHMESVLAIYGIQALFALLAIFLRYESDGLVVAVFAGLLAALAVFPALARRLRWRRQAALRGMPSALARRLQGLADSGRLERACYYCVRLAIPLLLLAGSLAGRRVGFDVATLSLSVLALWALASWPPLGLPPKAGRAAIYSCVALVVYAVDCGGLARPELERCFHHAIFALAFVVGMGVRFSPRFFSVTPSDFLVMFILVAAANLPVFAGENYPRLAAEFAVVLYGVEYLLRRGETAARWLRLGAALALAVFAGRGFA